MRQLPRELTFLDRQMQNAGKLTRLGSEDQFCGRRLYEADYDDLIVRHLPSIADCLREAGLINADHDVVHIGNQIEKIDVLCAEVGADESFKRFVVIEDKLCRNPEGRRDVLGQIVDYSRRLHELDFNDFAELVPEGRGDWCELNRVAISLALAEHRMLLLICSDQVRDSLVEYARYLNDTFPLRQIELALMSLNIYSDGERHLFVPNVSGTMPMPSRTLVVRVELAGQIVQPGDARITAEWHSEEGGGGRTRIKETELLQQIGPDGSVERNVAEALIKGAADIGADVEFGDASAKARIYNANSRKPATLFVVTRRKSFYVRSFSRWLQAAAVGPDLSDDYLRQLTGIVGKSPLMAAGDAAGMRAIKLADLRGKEDRILEVVQRFIPTLRDSPAPDAPGE